jgi:diaminopimelate decarboxylase
MDLIDLFPESTVFSEASGIIVAGRNLVELAREWGTPLYIYDGATIRGQVLQLQELLRKYYGGPAQVTYAAKAYFSLAVARHLAELGLGVDVVSLGELGVARRAGFEPGAVHLHGNNKSSAEMKAAIDWGVQAVVVDSLEELDVLAELAAVAQKQTRIWLRITPGITVDTHHYTQTAHPASKFGLPIQDGQAALAIRRALAQPWLKLTGLHTHLGSQFFETGPYQQAIDMLVELADGEGYIPEEISPGGGWGVPYHLDGMSSSPRPWIEAVGSALQAACGRKGWPLPRLVVEPGRWMVARAGVALYTVGTTKTASDGTHLVAVDGGLADNPRPALYQAKYTACLAGNPLARPVQRCALVGKFCESGDILIQEVDLPAVQRGDVLAVPVAGAYQLSMASNYNLAARPPVLWLDEGQVQVMQKREWPQESGWWSGD